MLLQRPLEQETEYGDISKNAIPPSTQNNGANHMALIEIVNGYLKYCFCSFFDMSRSVREICRYKRSDFISLVSLRMYPYTMFD